MPTRSAKDFLPALAPRAKADRLDSYGLARDGLAADLPPFPIKSETMATLTAQVAALDAQIAAARWEEEVLASTVARLEAVLGIGPVTATAVASCLMSKPFDHPHRFVASVGLDVRVRDSGQGRGQHTLSHHGDTELRRLLYLCALANVRARDPANPFKVQYERERAKGLAMTAPTSAASATGSGHGRA